MTFNHTDKCPGHGFTQRFGIGLSGLFGDCTAKNNDHLLKSTEPIRASHGTIGPIRTLSWTGAFRQVTGAFHSLQFVTRWKAPVQKLMPKKKSAAAAYKTDVEVLGFVLLLALALSFLYFVVYVWTLNHLQNMKIPWLNPRL